MATVEYLIYITASLWLTVAGTEQGQLVIAGLLVLALGIALVHYALGRPAR